MAAVKTKVKGLSATEPTSKELEDILKTFAIVDDEENWVIYKKN